MTYIVLVAIAAAVIIDQALKIIVINTLEIGQTIPLIEGVFHFTYIQNFGAAFSILQNRQIFLIAITVCAIIAAMIVLLKNIKKFNRFLTTGITLIVGGGIGNLIDRIRLGYVVDFLDFRAINYPVFNFADCCVVLGAAAMIWGVFVMEKKNREQTRDIH